jgi:DNA-binding NarL/FixJ family response regulator
VTIQEAHPDLVTLRDTVNRNWSMALQSYREAIDLYRRVLAISSGRRARVSSRPTTPPAILISPRAAQAPRGQPLSFKCLTPREYEVLQLITLGFTNQQIAERLVLSKGTVANHVAHILTKLALANRTQVAALALRPPGLSTTPN